MTDMTMCRGEGCHVRHECCYYGGVYPVYWYTNIDN